MKKLIAIAVVLVLAVGAAFAVDVSGHIIGTVNVLENGTNADGDDVINASAELNRVRLDGSGEAGDGKFGGYIRLESFEASATTEGDFSGKPWETAVPRLFKAYGNAWWKPIDQFKLLIGSNGGDGFIGKEGVTGWMFQQTVYDTGVAVGAGNIWGGGYGSTLYRNAFFEGGGDGGNAAYLFITPVDMVAVNVILPFFNGGELGDVFKKLVAQVDLKFDFGNIAFTYQGGLGYDEDKGIDDPAAIFIYYGGSFGAINLDVGFGYPFAKKGGDEAQPLSIGLGLKYSADAFGVKFRAIATLGGEDKSTAVLAEVLPYFTLGDNLAAFVSAGLAITAPDEGDSVTGWHLNPYIQVGEEWGAKFLAGIKLWSDGNKQSNGDDAKVNWGVPIAIIVSF